MRNRNMKRAVKLALHSTGTLASTSFVATARVQHQGTAASEGELEQVIVTGSRIPQRTSKARAPCR